MMLAFSAGMIFGVFGFEQVAEFVGIEKGSSLASGLHLHSAGIREASTKIAAVDSQGNGLLCDISVEIEPGDGDVFYRVQPYAQVDLQYSAETAAEVAARTCSWLIGIGNRLGIGPCCIQKAYVFGLLQMARPTSCPRTIRRRDSK